MKPIGEQARDRFRDPWVHVYQFTDEVLVRCPSCGGRAVVFAHLGPAEHQRLSGESFVRTRRRLRCPVCGLFRDEFPASSVFGAPVDPYFRLPVWFQAECCGHILWAYNVQHLDLLESYVGARLRERGARPVPYAPTSMLERLPAWLKSAKHRDEILRTIRRMRASLTNG